MADAGIKKIIIKKNNLPPIGPNNNLMVRYRVVSEDKNRFSHWSPRYNLISQIPTSVNGAIEVTSKTINITWTDISDNKNKSAYDIFAKIDSGSFIYYGTTYSNNFSFLNSGGNSVTVAIQIESYKKERNAALTIYTDTESLL